MRNGGQICYLRDGRKMGFEIFGDCHGRPVLFFGGFPGSRLDGSFIHEPCKRLGLKIISMDRPGYGLSDHGPHYSIIDLTEDISELVEHLGIEKFAVIGTSGGGPYGLAVAYKFPERVVGAVVVCGIAPLSESLMAKYMRPYYRGLILLTSLVPFVLNMVINKHAFQVNQYPDRVIEHLINKSPQCDREVLNIPSVRELAILTAKEAYRNGCFGAVTDGRLYLKDWGFSLSAIKVRTEFWYGTEDEIVPMDMGLFLADSIPGSELHFIENEGHCSLLYNHSDSILRTVVGYLY